MGIRTTNVGNLFRDTRSRVIIIVTALIVLIAILFGWYKLRSGPGIPTVVTVGQVPSIQSIPGSLNPTEQYAKLQQEQNIQQAQAAKQTGGSAIPTIIRTELFSAGQPPVGSETGVPFSVLARKLREGGGIEKGLWFDELKKSNCAKDAIEKARQQGATLELMKEAGCTANQLLAAGYNLPALKQAGYSAADLKAAGFNAMQLRAAGFDAAEIKKAKFSACDAKNAGYSAADLKKAGYSDGELLGAGFEPAVIQAAAGGLPLGISTEQIRQAGCNANALSSFHRQGVGASVIRQISGCSVAALKQAGYTAADLKAAGIGARDLKNAGYTAADLKGAGYTDGELAAAGYTPAEIVAAGRAPTPVISSQQIREAGCNPDAVSRLYQQGISATAIRQTSGCPAQVLKNAGYSPADLKAAGYTASDLKAAGYSPKQLRDAGFSARDLKGAGFLASDLRDAGFPSDELKGAGFTATDLRQAGASVGELQRAGFTPDELAAAGIIPAATTRTTTTTALTPEQAELQRIMAAQATQANQQDYQQRLQSRQSTIGAQASALLTEWAAAPTQTVVVGVAATTGAAAGRGGIEGGIEGGEEEHAGGPIGPVTPAVIKTGDILFAVLDTAVNSDEPGPVLATITQGKLKGAKLIGSLRLPPNGSRVILSFNVLSIASAPSTISINAVAIDPNTARTAIASDTDYHYLSRYGSLFAASFLEGWGRGQQQSATTVNITPFSSTFQTAERSNSQLAQIALGQVGQAWGRIAQRNAERPPTVYVYSGEGVGILFLQDISSIPGVTAACGPHRGPGMMTCIADVK